MCAAVEVPHGLVEVAKCLLLHSLRPLCEPRIVCTSGCELPALFQIPGRELPARTPPGVLLHSQVPYVPGVGAVPEQDDLLLSVWLKTVPRHAEILMENIFKVVL
jgi:hypothetical protein